MRNKKRGRPVIHKEPQRIVEKPVSKINKWLFFDNVKSTKLNEDFARDKKKYRRWLCKMWGIPISEFNELMHKPYKLSVLQIEHIAKETGKHPVNLFYAAGRDSTIYCHQKELQNWDSKYALTHFYTDVSDELRSEIAKYRAAEKFNR